ncbi:MAG: phosphatase PAP2 family protein [Tsuneonella sp.]
MDTTEVVQREAAPLFAFDSKVRDVMMRYRKTPPVRVISWLSEVGDQPQLRVVGGAALALGVLRADLRLVQAAARMLFAHEAAVLLKNAVKDRVDRTRPKIAPTPAEQEPHPGTDTSKEETSFPSGHSAGAIAVTRAFSRVYPRRTGVALALGTSVAAAQVPRCSHYPTDVAAGLAVGAVAEKLTDFAWRLAARLVR